MPALLCIGGPFHHRVASISRCASHVTIPIRIARIPALRFRVRISPNKFQTATYWRETVRSRRFDGPSFDVLVWTELSLENKADLLREL